VRPILLLILASNTIMVFRAYYFAQILFVDNGSKLLLIANVAHAIVTATLSLVLIPQYGAGGAAFSLMMGHVVALTCYAWSWRGSYVTKLPYGDCALIVVSGLAAYALMEMIDAAVGRGFTSSLLGIAVFAALALATAWKFKILSINELAKPLARILSRRREGPAT
jgi:O-antigen/teichoic acid export membrane protein